MYVDKKRRRWPYFISAVLLLAIAGLIVWRGAQVSAANLQEESAVALRAAIQRSALQCYVVEGAYPSNLAYLEENYGLQINTEDFHVVYDAFASNLPPYVQVTVRP